MGEINCALGLQGALRAPGTKCWGNTHPLPAALPCLASAPPRGQQSHCSCVCSAVSRRVGFTS